MRYVVAKLVGAVVAGVLAASGTAVPAAADDILDWSECADLEPPDDEILLEARNSASPSTTGAARPLARPWCSPLSRVPASGQRRGVLVVNPGGPGSPGRAWAGIVAMRLLTTCAPPTTSWASTRGDRRVPARCRLRSPPTSPRCAPTRFRGRAGRARARGPGRRPSPRLRGAFRAPPAPHDHRGPRHRPGRSPAGARRGADRLPRLLVRHLPGRGLCHPLPRAGAPPRAGQHRPPWSALV